VVPVLAETAFGGRVRIRPRKAVTASTGLRVDLEVEDELDGGACAATGGVVPVLSGPEAGGRVRGGLEDFAGAATRGVVPFLPETESSGSDLSAVTAAGAPSARRRLGPIAGIGPGINVGAGPRS